MENKEQEPKKRFFKLTHYNLDRANNGHAIILVLVGAYLIYMTYFIVKNYIDGETSMKLSTTVIVTIIMVAVAVGIFIYAGVVFYISRNREEIGREQDIEFGYVDEEGNPTDAASEESDAEDPESDAEDPEPEETESE